MKQSERTLHQDRKKALAALFTQGLVVIGYIACLAANVQKFSDLGLVLMFLLIAIMLILAFVGFNAIFYIDQGKLGLFKILNVIVITVFIAFHIIMQLFMRSSGYESEYGDDGYTGEFAISSVLAAIILILDIIMIGLVRSLSTKWNTASERSQIKSAVFDRMSYENILQTSLLLENNDTKKSRYSNSGK